MAEHDTTAENMIVNLAISLIVDNFHDLSLAKKIDDQANSPKRFKRLRAEVDNCYAQEAIDWFEGNIEADNILSYETCCEIIQGALLDEKTSINPCKYGIKKCMEYKNISEVAEITGLTEGRLRVLLSRGEFPGAGKFKKYGQTRESWLIPEKDIEAFQAKERPAGRKKGGV